MSNIPQWAFDRLVELENELPVQTHYYARLRKVFAHYIMQHEKPPVDPIEHATDELMKAWVSGDRHQIRLLVMDALKRGMELAKDQS